MSPSPLVEVEAIAADAREIFEQLLLSSFGKAETRGACLYASMMLATMVTKFAKSPSLVCGGGPPMDGGLLDKSGVLRGHYWVEGHTASGTRFVVDITADQFGYEKVVVLGLAEARERYFPGDRKLIAQHVRNEQASWPTDPAP